MGFKEDFEELTVIDEEAAKDFCKKILGFTEEEMLLFGNNNTRLLTSAVISKRNNLLAKKYKNLNIKSSKKYRNNK